MRQWLGLVARLLTGSVWLWAGASKLGDLATSRRAVGAYELLPESLVGPIGTVLPALEVVVGLLLLLGWWVRPAAIVSAVLFAAFIVGIASVWARGIEIDCGCFGGGGAEEGASARYPGEIARDILLLAASVWLVVRPTTRWALAGWVGHDVRDWGARQHDHSAPQEHEHDVPGTRPDTRRDR